VACVCVCERERELKFLSLVWRKLCGVANVFRGATACRRL